MKFDSDGSSSASNCKSGHLCYLMVRNCIFFLITENQRDEMAGWSWHTMVQNFRCVDSLLWPLMISCATHVRWGIAPDSSLSCKELWQAFTLYWFAVSLANNNNPLLRRELHQTANLVFLIQLDASYSNSRGHRTWNVWENVEFDLFLCIKMQILVSQTSCLPPIIVEYIVREMF